MRDKTPYRRKEIRRADYENALDGFGIVCRSHVAGGLEQVAQGPEFADADAGEVDYVC